MTEVQSAARFEKVVVITQKTALEELIERFNTRPQARFYLEQMGIPFGGYQSSHDAYQAAVSELKQALPQGVRSQFVERSFLPNYLFGERDLVLTLGRDGLVVNTAKYLSVQPLLAFNPDPQRIDGVLLPFHVSQAAGIIRDALAGRFASKQITMAKAALNNGQVLYAVNDLFVGQRTHLSARYRLQYRNAAEDQSSSGIIISTGAGSTGWFRSILTGASAVVESFARQKGVRQVREKFRFDWESPHLFYSVREPFISKVSAAELVFGRIDKRTELVITSQMPQNGVIFSDGIEADYLEFNSGAIARIGPAERKVNLIVSSGTAA
jgi:NAD kinase